MSLSIVTVAFVNSNQLSQTDQLNQIHPDEPSATTRPTLSNRQINLVLLFFAMGVRVLIAWFCCSSFSGLALLSVVGWKAAIHSCDAGLFPDSRAMIVVGVHNFQWAGVKMVATA